MPDISKRKVGQSEKAAGNPAGHPGVRSPAMSRTSEPLTAGHASPSSGDHGVGQGRSAEAAWRHSDLRNQASTSVMPWQSLSTRNQDRPDAGIIWGAGRVNVEQLHQPEVNQFTSQPSGNPNMRDYSPHSARGSATGPNGGHDRDNPTSRSPVSAMKSSEAREALKRHMFPGSGGGR